MANRRDKIPVDVQRNVFIECGFRCAVPTCRYPVPLEVHHLCHVSEGGGNNEENLLVLCRNCHGMYHEKTITAEALMVYKRNIQALTQSFDQKGLDVLLLLSDLGKISCKGEGLLSIAGLVASGFVSCKTEKGIITNLPSPGPTYHLQLTKKGKDHLNSWKSGQPLAAWD